eukprot:COSAG01_NODE_6245_length_3772_cov_12.433433_2_plen_84_part_00
MCAQALRIAESALERFDEEMALASQQSRHAALPQKLLHYDAAAAAAGEASCRRVGGRTVLEWLGQSLGTCETAVFILEPAHTD